MTVFLVVAAVGVVFAVVLLFVFALAVLGRDLPEDER